MVCVVTVTIVSLVMTTDCAPEEMVVVEVLELVNVPLLADPAALPLASDPAASASPPLALDELEETDELDELEEKAALVSAEATPDPAAEVDVQASEEVVK